MLPRSFLFGVLLCVCVAVSGNNLGPSLLFSHIIPHKLSLQAETTQPDSYSGNLDQTADHFDTTNTATFRQSYFCNTGYANGSGIYILYVEGWGTASSTRVSDESQPHVASAKDLGATVCSLEHRYFGQSSPTPSTNSVSDMALLTSEQAVEDISTAITALSTKFGETAAKWVLVGAGYGGSLALWHRELHPDVTVGVVGSGAPVNPAADFYRFQKNVEDVYNAFDPTCYSNLASGMKEVRHAAQSVSGRKNLSDSLQLQPSFDSLTSLNYNAFQFFYAVLGAVFSTPVLYNRVNYGPFVSGAGLADVCAVLNDASTVNDGVNRIVNATKYLVSNVTSMDYAGIPISYDQVVSALQTEDRHDFRLRFYQMRRELGWFPTTDYANYGLFGAQVPSNLWIDMCADVFGGPTARNVTTLAMGVNTTHTYYNTSATYNGSNALLTLGEWDPWKTLGAVSCSDPSSAVVVVTQGSHVAESYPAASTDSDSLTVVRQQVKDSIKKWLGASTTTSSSNRKVGHKEHRRAHRRHGRHHKFTVSEMAEGPKIKNWNTRINYNIPMPTRRQSTKPATPFIHFGHRSHSNRFYKELRKRVEKDSNRVENPMAPKKNWDSNVTYNNITQSLDHFDSTVTATWTQYFYANSKYYKDGAPNFLMFGGEGPLDVYDVSPWLTMGMWGQEYNAMLVSVVIVGVEDYEWFPFAVCVGAPLLRRIATLRRPLHGALAMAHVPAGPSRCRSLHQPDQHRP